MRLKEKEIEYTAWRILRKLKEKDEIIFFDSEEKVLERLINAITGELEKEDELNRRVEDLLKEHDTEIQRGSLDYRRMFQLIKKELAKKEGIIL